jgi:membrane associated rhomboid family serine protease
VNENSILTDSPVACAIFAITLIVSLIAFYNEDIYNRFILQPYSVARRERVYTLLTSGLIHRDWSHLLFNMMSYYFFAFQLERVLGHWQFGLLYVVSLILSDLPTVAKHRNDYWYRSLGASGAISAVVFSFIMFFPFASMYILFIPFPIKAIIFGGLYLIYCAYASKKGLGNINHDAHFYGALCGIGITIILDQRVVPHFIQQFSELLKS